MTLIDISLGVVPAEDHRVVERLLAVVGVTVAIQGARTGRVLLMTDGPIHP